MNFNNNGYPIVVTVKEFVLGLRIGIEEAGGVDDLGTVELNVAGYIGGANV